MRAFGASIFSMGMLYTGKISGVLVAFIFLPLYARLLGQEQFGIVAVILSVQALLVMMDFGMSTIVSREVAVASSKNDGKTLTLLRTAETGLTLVYSLIFLLAIVLSLAKVSTSLSIESLLGIALLFWVLVLQNLYYSALIASRSYLQASLIQILGVGVRAGITVYALEFFSSSLGTFILSQLLGGIIHASVTRYFCNVKLRGAYVENQYTPPDFKSIAKLLNMGRPIVLFSAAGAAVMQLDKPIISSLISASSVTSYYFAGMICLTPISILAGPVSQFFQPIFFKNAENSDKRKAYKSIAAFAFVITVVTLFPSVLLWLWRDPIISIWLEGSANVTTVADYAAILLPGVCIGALGFVPYSLLVYAKDFRFMAIMSSILTAVTLLATYSAAKSGNVQAICFIYSLYHAVSTFCSWGRAITLKEVRQYAWRSAVVVSVIIAVISIILIGIFNF